MLMHIPFYASLLGRKLTDRVTATHSHVLVYGAIEAHGFGPDGCVASNETISQETGLKESSVKTIISVLIRAGWLSAEIDEKNHRTRLLPLMGINLPLMGINRIYRNKNTVLDNTKLDKSNLGERDKRDPSVQAVIEHFEKELGIPQPAKNRRYASLLAKRYGLEPVKAMISATAKAQQADRYCPRTPTLEKFWFQKEALQDYFRRQDTNSDFQEIL